MKRLIKITFFLLFITVFTNCSRHRTYILTERGIIKRTHKNEVSYERNLIGIYDIDYYLVYNKEIDDTNELKAIIDNFIVIIIYFKEPALWSKPGAHFFGVDLFPDLLYLFKPVILLIF